MPPFRRTRIRALLAVALLALLALPAHAAPQDARWHTFTSLNGLAGNIVQAIWEDSHGLIWFGTENGVCRYDGQKWQVYRTADGLIDNNVWSISGDADSIWFATSSGLSQLRQGRWSSYSTADGLPNGDVRAIQVSRDGSVWVGTFGGGIARRAPGATRWEPLDISSIIPNRDVAVQSIWQAPGGALWFSTSAFGAVRLAGDKLDLFGFSRGGRNTVWSVGSWPGSETIWLATFRGIVKIAPDDTATVVDTLAGGIQLERTEVLALAADGRDSAWFGTRANGVLRYSGGAWERYTTADGLSRDYVLAILADRAGRVWFGTRGGGVTMRDPQPLAEARAIHATVTARDIQHDAALPLDRATLQFDQNSLRFTLSAIAGWRPSQAVSFRYWLSGGPGAAMQAAKTVQAAPTPGAGTVAVDFINLTPGTYTLHVAPSVDDIAGAEDAYSFTIPNAPPAFAADGLAIRADGAAVLSGATLPQALFGSTRQVQIAFAASDDATAEGQLRYEFRVDDAPEWRRAGGPSAALTLGQGRHRVAARALDADGNASAPTTLTVIVPPPLWVTILLYLAIVIVPGVAGGAAGAYLYRRWAQRAALLRAVRGHLIPYDVGPLITDPERFIGRRHVLDTILGGIDHNSFYIYGEKRIGKSSLLAQLKQRLLQRSALQSDRAYVPVFRNIQDAPQDQFWLSLIRGVADAALAPADLLAIRKPSGYDDFDAQDDLEAIIAHLAGQIAPRRPLIVLLLDEVDTLQRYDPIIRQRFRAFCQHLQDDLQVVLVGVQPPRAEASETSPWHNIFAPIALEPLAPDDVLTLIRSYNQNPYPYAPEAERALVAASDGKPFDTQWLCAESVKAMLAGRRTRVSLADVEQAIRVVVGERRREYAAFWQQAPAGLHALLRAARQHGGALPPEHVALGDYDPLIEAGLALSESSRYRLATLFQRWLRESEI